MAPTAGGLTGRMLAIDKHLIPLAGADIHYDNFVISDRQGWNIPV